MEIIAQEKLGSRRRGANVRMFQDLEMRVISLEKRIAELEKQEKSTAKKVSPDKEK